ncbi:MAG: ABC transporter permease [Anaerolineae bacterium]|nr:ABC transporter permease [Anaerolineae bacterium]
MSNLTVNSTGKSTGNTGGGSNALTRLLQTREIALVVMILIVGIILQVATGRFFTVPNLNAIALGFATSAIMVFGMTAALVSGGFDLSVGSVFALGGVIVAVALRDGVPIPLAMLLGVGVGLLTGFVNGLLITKAEINPFITTLGMLGIARGIGMAITEGSPLPIRTQDFLVYGQGRTFFDIPNLIIIALLVILIGDFLMRRSVAFRQIYFVGGNEEAARLSGINVGRVKIGVYALSGFLAALAGVLSTSRFTVADPGTGVGEELRIIAACIIGGCSLSGGKGTVIGGLIGLIFVGFINNGMTLLRVSVYWQQLTMGIVLLVAVGFDTLSQRWQARSRGKRKLST